MISKSLVITILITALIYGSGLNQARSESLPDQVKRVDDQVKKIENTLKKLQQKVKEPLNKELPVGTIIPSILNPIQFFAEFEDSEKSKWVLADGKNVLNSKYASVANKMNVPDLRGMFLRGIDERKTKDNQDPDGKREPGIEQGDMIKKHHHVLPKIVYDAGSKKDKAYSKIGQEYDHHYGHTETLQTFSTGGDETRPKNVAVYFYIKIN